MSIGSCAVTPVCEDTSSGVFAVPPRESSEPSTRTSRQGVLIFERRESKGGGEGPNMTQSCVLYMYPVAVMSNNHGSSRTAPKLWRNFRLYELDVDK